MHIGTAFINSRTSVVHTLILTEIMLKDGDLIKCSNEYCCGIGLSIPENELFNNNYSYQKKNEIDKWITESMKMIFNNVIIRKLIECIKVSARLSCL